MRVIGIDPGTITIDLCGLDDGRVFLDRSLPTADALADPAFLARLLDDEHRHAPIDLVAGPSGYGLPLIAARDLTDADLRLACLAAEGETGGIGGLRALIRALARTSAPVVLTPGVVHLPSVPAHRKINRVDMGTADKVCASALAVRELADERGCRERDVSLVLVELGGAFTAAIAVERGQIVDGLGGSSGPLGMRAAGAFDGEVAFLAGSVTKEMLFQGGVETVRLKADATYGAADATYGAADPACRVADPRYGGAEATTSYVGSGFSRTAYIEGILKAIAALRVSVPEARDVVLSGRLANDAAIRDELTRRLTGLSVHVLKGFASIAKQAAQGAALIADGLAGGRSAALVDAMGIREARGTVLDHLYVIAPDMARARLGIV